MFGGNVYRAAGTTFASDLWKINVVPGGLNWTQAAGPSGANVTGDYSNTSINRVVVSVFTIRYIDSWK